MELGKERVTVIPALETQPAVLRVAAYCRVSSDSADQLNSYAAQIRYYTEYIKGHEDWQLVDVYADRGITGTKAAAREEFLRLLRDCRRGKIDKVLVKSISRFARNTVDALSAVRELREHGVTIYFEERINTSESGDEFLLTVFNSIAQEDSVSISKNMKWSYQKRMQAGKFITCRTPYGYRLVNGIELEIQPEEAEIVRWIFKSYLNGMGTAKISDKLNRRGIPSPDKSIWRQNCVSRILKSEKYIGDTVNQKTYSTDSFPIRKVRNKGEKAQYYVTNTHPAIISRDEFAKAGERLKCQNSGMDNTADTPVFRGKIYCKECGAVYRKKKGQDRISWSCRTHDAGKERCPAPAVSELELQAAFVQMYNKLKSQGDALLKPALRGLREYRLKTAKNRPERLELSSEIAKLTDEAHVVAQLYARNLLDTEMYLAKSDAVNRRIAELSAKRRALSESEEDETEEQLEALILTLAESPERLYGFDRTLFEKLVERITVSKDYTVTFKLHCGLELGEKIYGEVK